MMNGKIIVNDLKYLSALPVVKSCFQPFLVFWFFFAVVSFSHLFPFFCPSNFFFGKTVKEVDKLNNIKLPHIIQYRFSNLLIDVDQLLVINNFQCSWSMCPQSVIRVYCKLTPNTQFNTSYCAILFISSSRHSWNHVIFFHLVFRKLTWKSDLYFHCFLGPLDLFFCYCSLLSSYRRLHENG